LDLPFSSLPTLDRRRAERALAGHKLRGFFWRQRWSLFAPQTQWALRSRSRDRRDHLGACARTC